MPQGDKSKYTDKQERKADHIAEGYEKRGVSEKEAERRAWATVNKDDGGGKKPGGSGRGKDTGHPAAHKGGEKGGKAAASRTAAERSASAKKAAAHPQAQRRTPHPSLGTPSWARRTTAKRPLRTTRPCPLGERSGLVSRRPTPRRPARRNAARPGRMAATRPRSGTRSRTAPADRLEPAFVRAVGTGRPRRG